MLTKSKGLTPAQLAAIETLETICNEADGLAMKLNPNTLRHRSQEEINDFLYEDGGTLIGYLALYGFNREEVEINGMVHPAYRRRGIFSHLVATAREEVRRRGIPDLLFICERASTSAAPTMQTLGARYDFSEYKMVLRNRAVPPVPWPDGLALRDGTPLDLEALARMDVTAFQTEFENSKQWLEKVFADDARRVWVITLNGRTIGKIQTTQSGDEIYINAFVILPEHRGKGYGKAVLSHIVTQLVDEKHPLISLEVATENENALSLYKRAGFATTTVYDYYRLPVG